MSQYQNNDTASWDARQVRSGAERAPSYPRRRRRRFPWFQYLLFVVLTSAVLAGVGWLLMNDLCSLNKEPITVTVEVTADDNLGSIANKLQDAGLIRYKWFFKLFGAVDKAQEKIGLGSYQLNSSMDYLALINAMHSSSGNLNADTVRVTIPEGYTVSQAIRLMAEKGVNTESALLEAAKTGKFDYSFIDATSQDISRLEGYLFPDTYDFYLNEKPVNALSRLIRNFSAKTSELSGEIKTSGYTLRQITIIASLIEKETDGTDQAKIASVIYNRLKDKGEHGTYGMLNIDASVLYALPEHTGALTAEDMKVDSPYNLYTHAGLPPTAIANPGMDSLEAAVRPEATEYYFYALGTDKLHHYFTAYNDFQNFLNSSSYGG